jgi:hypothetical protein
MALVDLVAADSFLPQGWRNQQRMAELVSERQYV